MRHLTRQRKVMVWGLPITYLEASFVEIVNVVIKDPIFSRHVVNKAEPISNNYRIFALNSFVIILAIKFRLDLWTAIDEVCSPVFANRGRVALCEEKISYFLHILWLGRKSTRI